MGYELTRFIGNIDEELQCSICTMVLELPVQTRCEHFYCKNCIRHWLQLRPVCPMDGKPLTIADLKHPCRLLRNLLGKLDIRCRYYDWGCPEITHLDNLDKHHGLCTFNPDAQVRCDKGCNLIMSRRDFNAYDCRAHYEKRISDLEMAIQWERNKKDKEIGQLKASITKSEIENNKLRSHLKIYKSKKNLSMQS